MRLSPLAVARSNRYQKQIVELATKNRLPSMFEVSVWVEAGGLLSYSADDAASFRRAAYYVDKILKGAKPADLPVEQPTKFEFVINLKTAKQIGLTIPPNVLARAESSCPMIPQSKIENPKLWSDPAERAGASG